MVVAGITVEVTDTAVGEMAVRTIAVLLEAVWQAGALQLCLADAAIANPAAI